LLQERAFLSCFPQHLLSYPTALYTKSPQPVTPACFPAKSWPFALDFFLPMSNFTAASTPLHRVLIEFLNREVEGQRRIQRLKHRSGATLPWKRRVVMKLRPLHDRVVVKRLEEEEKTAGGIIIPDTAKEKPQQGKVIAVGKGRILEDGKVIPLVVKADDRILFSKYAGTDIKVDGEEHLIMREDDILAIFE
jgi:chaperonin GroES